MGFIHQININFWEPISPQISFTTGVLRKLRHAKTSIIIKKKKIIRRNVFQIKCKNIKFILMFREFIFF